VSGLRDIQEGAAALIRAAFARKGGMPPVWCASPSDSATLAAEAMAAAGAGLTVNPPSFAPEAAGSCDLPYGYGTLEIAAFEQPDACRASGTSGALEAVEEAVRALNRATVGGHMLQLDPSGIRSSAAGGTATCRAAFRFDWQFG
jgi:hypothetical protein